MLMVFEFGFDGRIGGGPKEARLPLFSTLTGLCLFDEVELNWRKKESLKLSWTSRISMTI